MTFSGPVSRRFGASTFGPRTEPFCRKSKVKMHASTAVALFLRTRLRRRQHNARLKVLYSSKSTPTAQGAPGPDRQKGNKLQRPAPDGKRNEPWNSAVDGFRGTKFVNLVSRVPCVGFGDSRCFRRFLSNCARGVLKAHCISYGHASNICI